LILAGRGQLDPPQGVNCTLANSHAYGSMPGVMSAPHTLDLDGLATLPTEQIPAVLVQIAAAQTVLAARLLAAPPADAPTAGDRLLTAAEAAEVCGVTADWLYRHADTLPYTVRVGRSLRFSRAGIDRWIRARSGR
jgi:predicted DNA-binding transcriptional regulator AlpA